MKPTKKHAVSKKKIQKLSELTKLAKESRTILVASTKSLPLSQYQEIAKKLRGKAEVKVPRKSLIIRMLDSLGDESAEKFKSSIKESSAIFFSDMDAFDLAAELVGKRSPARAKAGQEAQSDIEVQEGPTELIPGPAISELGALGIQIQIEKGKINIKESKVIVKKGEKISAPAEAIMNKLGIKPFFVGFVPLSALDTKEKKVYLEIKIDREATLNELKTAFGKALPFAVAIGYTSPETIKFLIGKAGMQEKALSALVGKHDHSHASEAPSENKADEETKSESEENK
jgi:large subunit ribosomal protein L10